MVKYKKEDINAIAFELKNNKSLIAPTDTIYGILSRDVNNIYKIKKREKSKKVILFIPDVSFIEGVDEKTIKIANQFWPGPLTLIKKKISYRIPNKKFLLDLLKITGPLYCSSANISGQKPIETYDEAINIFLKYKNDIIFIEDSFKETKPSTIYDIDKDKVLREGEISYDQIKRCIE